MSDVQQLKTKESTSRAAPNKIKRPCDYGLDSAVINMESQVGTVEAYNKLCDAAMRLKAKIDLGEARQALEFFATNPDFIYPAKY
jgi:hypothetical protein